MEDYSKSPGVPRLDKPARRCFRPAPGGSLGETGRVTPAEGIPPRRGGLRFLIEVIKKQD